MFVVGLALPRCQLVVRQKGHRSQGSVQWFPLPQLSLVCFWVHHRVMAPGNFLPASYQHSKTAWQGNQLVFLPMALKWRRRDCHSL